MNPIRRVALPFALTFALGSTAIAARSEVRSVSFHFTPTNQVDSTRPALPPLVSTVPLRVQVVDGRAEGSRDVLGTWTTDDDRILALPLAQDLLPELDRAMALEGASWGVPMTEGAAERVLTVTLLQATVSELNKAVGASYRGSLNLQGSLEARDGSLLWSGYASGEASRYGRAASDANVCEVLSDALVEAWAAMLGSQTLQVAWVGDAPAATIPSP
ncbi:MAG: hypothetical protein ABIO70_01150 [Pseudomonadota bacterium]